MKKESKYIFFFLLLALAACSNEEIFAPETPQPGNGAIELTVSAGDFVTDGAPLTRAAESNDGKTITFESGDRIGLIIVADNGSTLVADNLPYKYDGTSWAFDAANGEGKTAPYYDNGIENVTYIAYFPYSSSAGGTRTLDELKSKFAPKTNQRSEADYRASDLLVWTSGAASVPQKMLDIALAHAYASISLSPEVKCTLADGNSTALTYIPSRVSDVSFTIGSDVCLPFQAEDGSFRCILPAGTSSSVRWFYTFGGETYGGSRDFGSGTTANTRYVRQETIENRGTYGLDKVQAGDFYCMNASGEGYLVPGDIASLPSEQKNACIGIVYWMGDITGEDLLLKRDKPGCTHGLVMALQDAGGNLRWSSSNEDITNNWLSQQTNTSYGISSLKEQNKMQGYANTKALKDYNTAKGVRVLPIDLIGTYVTTHPTPASSSGWYWPSFMELKYMCWGQNNSSGVAGRNMLNAQLYKVSGAASLQSDRYWSSTENDNDRAWRVGFSDGSVNIANKLKFSNGVRAVVAF